MKIPKGTQFGSWTVIGPETKSRRNPRGFRYYILCRCVCGKEKPVPIEALKYRRSKSCGCQRKNTLTHGLSGTAEYLTWLRMKQRCYDKNCTRYEYWGGRGIKVCDQWKHSFTQFLEDMGPKPASHYSLGRIDNAKNYSPDNCSWVTPKEQSRNTRRNRRFTHNGLTLTLVEWSELTGISRTTITQRIDACGWSVEKALTTPVLKRITHFSAVPADDEVKIYFISNLDEPTECHEVNSLPASHD